MDGGFYEWVIEIFFASFESLWTLVTDMAIWVLEAVLAIVLATVGTLGAIPGVDLLHGALNSLPPDMWYLATRLGIPQCTSIFVGAVVIRIILQLIPFVRLGS